MTDDSKESGWKSRRFCHCSRRTKFIICGAISLPVIVFLVLIIALLINTAVLVDPYKVMKFSDDEPQFMTASEEEMLERAKRLAGAINFPTVSFGPGNMSLAELDKLNVYITKEYPELHNSTYVQWSLINKYSRLYRVQGSEDTGNPYMLTAHLDVVPEGDLSKWTEGDPFNEGVKDNKIIFGRGSIDDKHLALGILEALSYKVKKGEQPKRTFYIGLGHDEEISGTEGARKISDQLKIELETHGEKLDFLMDEGLFVMTGVMPGVSDPLILIGVCEKGWATMEMVTEFEQVHSSIPPKESAIGVLSGAVSRMEAHRQPSRFGKGPEIDTIRYAAPHADFLYKMALGNLWLTGDIVSAALGSVAETDSVQRTTTAITIFNAGFKENVVPGTAKATVNHRLHSVDDYDSVLKHDKKSINDDRVRIDLKDYRAPTPVSQYSNDFVPFQLIAVSALEVYPDAHPVPGVMVANTDTLHYTEHTDQIYRFSPIILNLDTLSMFHGVNEKISVVDYDKVVQFFYRLMTNADFDRKPKKAKK